MTGKICTASKEGSDVRGQAHIDLASVLSAEGVAEVRSESLRIGSLSVYKGEGVELSRISKWTESPCVAHYNIFHLFGELERVDKLTGTIEQLFDGLGYTIESNYI